MHIIPVIDIRYGQAVRAVGGDRALYRPLVTPFASNDDPVAVAQGLLAHFPCDTLYLADLDGIEGRGANRELIARLAATLTNTDLWLDDGMTGTPHAPSITPIVGSESLVTQDNGQDWRTTYETLLRFPQSFVLSLDFRGDRFLGPPELLATPALWPNRAIVMTLGRVGGNALGPDMDLLIPLVRRAQHRQVFAAGGVRDLNDLRSLQAAGVHGALVATALHSGKLRPEDLRSFHKGTNPTSLMPRSHPGKSPPQAS